MESIISKDPINFGRQRELDVAKALAIIFMVLVHVQEEYLGAVYENGLFHRIVEFLGSPLAAPVFMFLLGVGLVYSKRNDAKSLFKRGIHTAILAFVLNVFRYYVPLKILQLQTGDVSYGEEAWTYLWDVDILPLAALVFIFFAIVKKFKISNVKLAAIWFMIALVNLLVEGISFESHFLNVISGFFWGSNHYSYFPFFVWISYPILGYYFGLLLVRCKNKDVFYKNLCLVSGALSALLWYYSYVRKVEFGAFGGLYQDAYYHHDFIAVLVMGSLVLFWLSLCYLVSKRLPEAVLNLMGIWSKNLTVIYCIHWVIIGFSWLFIDTFSLTPVSIIFMAICVFIASDMLSRLYTKWKMNKNCK